jgi:DedD protein
MALPPLLKRRSAQSSDPVATDATELQARTRARRRLIGAAVLLVVGVIAFPLLFETQPRPIPVDIPMVIPSRDGAAPLSVPPRPARVASGSVAEVAPERQAHAIEAAAPAAATVAAAAAKSVDKARPAASGVVERAASAAKPIQQATPKPAAAASAAEPRPIAKAAEKAPEKLAEKAPEKVSAKAEAKPAEAAGALKPGRYVVQVGAYADDASANQARQKVEKLGLKTYTQSVDVNGVRRIRVRIGPFDTADEANKALGTLKAGKLPGAVLAL